MDRFDRSYWTKRRRIRANVSSHMSGIKKVPRLGLTELCATANNDEKELSNFSGSENEGLGQPLDHSSLESDSSEMPIHNKSVDDMNQGANIRNTSNNSLVGLVSEPEETDSQDGDSDSSSLYSFDSFDESLSDFDLFDDEFDEILDGFEDFVEDDGIAGELSAWSTQFQISHTALRQLLKILRPIIPALPKDPRTLLGTRRSYDLKDIQGGQYHHFGFRKGILKCSKELLIHSNDMNKQTLKINVNIDGLPIFKSSKTQFWPILGMVMEPFISKVFIIGVFCGNQKPIDVHEYLEDFVDEMILLERDGLMVEGSDHLFSVELSCLICDAPARAYVKQVKSHNAYHGCERCTQRGKWISKVTFPETDAPARTDASFDEMRDTDHHVGTSPLSRLSFGMVSQFTLDPMHLVYLGVMKRLLGLWMKGPVKTACRIGHNSISQVSKALITFRDYIPREFPRKCRPLSEVERWKATEFRQFLLYSGIVALKGKISEEFYKHFLVLFVAIYCLACPITHISHCDYARQLIIRFVQQWGQLYGKEMLVYNVHSMIHLASDVEAFGPLDTLSAFPFESFLGRMKKLVRKPNYPLSQVIRRLSELKEKHSFFYSQSVGRSEVPRSEHYSGPLPFEYRRYNQFLEVWRSGLYFSCHDGNNCIKVGSRYGLVCNIIQARHPQEDAQVLLLFQPFTVISDFFDYPLPSSDLGIVKASGLSADLRVVGIGEVDSKLMMLPHKEHYVLIPLIHQFL